jgi:protein SCO1/2
MKITVVLISCMLATGLPGASAIAADDVFAELSTEFSLLDADGAAVTLDSFHGKNVLLTFGFTHCQHICPMIAANMARALKGSEKEAVGIFVSVDTERDTPAITTAYARGFGTQMTGLGGSHEQVATAARNFGVTFVVTKSEDNYTVQHTPSIFLIGPDGDMVDVFAMNTPTSDIIAAMR